VIAGGVGKEVDALLIDLHPIAVAQVRPYELVELVDSVDRRAHWLLLFHNSC
jgi:hypothetical protein